MYKSIMALVLAVLGIAVVGSNARAQATSYSLATVASHNGYNVQWLLPERSVRLYRPGLVIVIRPGAIQYEVNNRVEFADAAPRYVNGDLLVTSSLAARLARLASIAAVASMPAPGVRFAQAPPVASVSGPITLDVHPQAGSEALTVSGHAPSAAPVTITLLATLSPDLPTVVVSRHDVQPDANGQFQATISIASDYLRNSTIRVLATSSAGATPASATVTVGAPNAGSTVPSDQTYCPNGICP
jgi:hypothetical protein